MSPNPRFCGIDTGESCALAVREREGETVRWVYFEALPIERLVERCGRIFAHLGVEGMVIDGGPHTQAARAAPHPPPARAPPPPPPAMCGSPARSCWPSSSRNSTRRRRQCAGRARERSRRRPCWARWKPSS